MRRLRAVRRLAAARRPPRRRRALRSLVALARRSSCAGLANAPDWRRTACSSFAHDPASVLTMPEFDSQAAGAKAFSRRMPFERKKNPKKQKSATARWNLAKRARREPAPMDVEDGMRLRVPRIAHASRIACVAHAALTFRLLSFAHRLMLCLAGSSGAAQKPQNQEWPFAGVSRSPYNLVHLQWLAVAVVCSARDRTAWHVSLADDYYLLERRRRQGSGRACVACGTA